MQLVVILFSNTEFNLNYVKLVSGDALPITTFRSFYAEDLFAQMKDYIQKPQKEYRVVSVGLHPSISQYNGFYALDSYQNNYPLSYKLKFRDIIAKELDKNDGLKREFDNWGNRCYMYNDELKNSCYLKCLKDSNEKIEHLDINTKALRGMGAEYVFSSVPISNHQEIDLNFEKKFDHPDSKWSVYLYSL